MDPLFHAITLWSGAAASALVSATWQGLILACCIAVCLRLSPNSNAAGRSLLWMVGYLVTVLLHFSFLLARSAPHHPNHGALAQTVALRVSPIWGLAIACVWVLLSIYRAARLAAGAWSLRRIAHRATPINCDAACISRLKSGRRRVELCRSQDIDRPSVIGFHSPRILLPPALLTELSSSELEQVILHELEHLRRADDWTNLLQKLVLVFFPLNPVLLWMEHRLCTERELACDDGVLRQTRARKAYASCLTHLAEHLVLRQVATLALGAWERQSELSRRIYRILRQPEPAFTIHHTRWVTAVLALVLLTGAGELARSPQLIRFAPQPELAQTSSPQATLPGPTAHLVTARVALPHASFLATPAAPAARYLARPATLTRAYHHPVPSLRAVSTHPVRATAPWVVLTSFTRPYGSRSLAIQPDISPTYAAVPVADGWLIIQL